MMIKSVIENSIVWLLMMIFFVFNNCTGPVHLLG